MLCVGPCHHGMARPRVADGGYGQQVWSVAGNVLNKQLQTSGKGWSSSLEVGQESKDSSIFN